jgi:hypothetical protein
MTKNLILMAVLAAGLTGGVALAQTPWGGSEDGGFIPPDKPTASCENAMEKALAKAITCVAKCHQSRAAGKLADETAEENCESNVSNAKSCKARFNKTRDKLLNSGNCPSCLNQTAMDQLFAQSEAFIDTTTNGQVYCH